MPPRSSKRRTGVLQRRKVFLTCLFVWASDELIGTGTDWLLLREGGNFSVILWLIIALKYVTVPTPSEVFDRKLWCVFTQAGTHTDSYLAPTPREVTQLLLTVFATDACMFQTVVKYCVAEKDDTAVLLLSQLVCLKLSERFFKNTCCSGNWRPDRRLERKEAQRVTYMHDTRIRQI